MRVRYGAPGLPGEAAPDPQLRLEEARLYVVTPDLPAARVVEIATAAVRGGADIVQLRHKTLPRGELLRLARRLRDLITEALFIVNDHADIAVLSGADGVHLGPDDLSIGAARRVGGDRLLIGASASTIDAARSAVAEGADYIGCGAAFATAVKSEKKIIGPQGVAQVARALAPVPVFAIGGVNESNLHQLTDAGIHRACVIGAIAAAADPEQAARRLRAMLGA